MKRKIMALFLSSIMVLSMAACGGGSGSNSGNSGSGEEGSSVAATVTEPITITLWHTRGAGANGTEMDRVVKEFNDTNEYGIKIESEYIGSYASIMPKLLTGVAAGNNPVMFLTSQPYMATLMEKGILADLTPYVERDSMDMENFPEKMMEYTYYNDQILSLPYIVSSSVFVYNKAMFTQAGVEAPTTIAELEEIGPKVTQATGKTAFAMPIDPTYMQDALLQSLGGNGIIDADGENCSCINDGTFAQLANDWYGWIKEGWCKAPNITSANTDILESFYQGGLASCIVSSGSLQNILTECEGFVDVGVAAMPGYEGLINSIGGANIAVIKQNHSDQEVAAAWEFIKFLMSDEQLAQNAINTGYLPVTYSSTETDLIKQHWIDVPEAKVAFDQVEWATVPAFSKYTNEWYDQMTNAFSYVVQAQNMTGEQAADYLKKQYTSVFE